MRATGYVRAGVLAAMGVGLAHGTLGWRITDAFLGGGLPGGADSPSAHQEFVATWLLLSGAVGVAGAWAARLFARRDPSGAS